MSKGTFGEQLKREREIRGVSLDEISASTRIAVRFLQAIENEQWDQLPGGVFNRGFVRAMARYLGLDEESIVAEYALVAQERPTVPVWTGTPPAVTPQQPWLPLVLVAVLALAVIVGGWFGVRRLRAWRAARRARLSIAPALVEPEPRQTIPAGPITAGTVPAILLDGDAWKRAPGGSY